MKIKLLKILSVLTLTAVILLTLNGCWFFNESSTNYRSYDTIEKALKNVYPAFTFDGPVMPEGYTLKKIQVEGGEILRLTYEEPGGNSLYFNAYASESKISKSVIWDD